MKNHLTCTGGPSRGPWPLTDSAARPSLELGRADAPALEGRRFASAPPPSIPPFLVNRPQFAYGAGQIKRENSVINDSRTRDFAFFEGHGDSPPHHELTCVFITAVPIGGVTPHDDHFFNWSFRGFPVATSEEQHTKQGTMCSNLMTDPQKCFFSSIIVCTLLFFP